MRRSVAAIWILGVGLGFGLGGCGPSGIGFDFPVEDGERAVRTDRVTYVFEHGGEFELPGLELAWWDTGTGRIATAQAEPIRLDVAVPVNGATPASDFYVYVGIGQAF